MHVCADDFNLASSDCSVTGVACQTEGLNSFVLKQQTSVELSVALGILGIRHFFKAVLSWCSFAALRVVRLFGRLVTKIACVW